MTSDGFLIRGGVVLTMEPALGDVRGDVLIQGGRIAAVGEIAEVPAGAQVIDAGGCLVLPGLVQAHIHLCQTLARGYADDLPLLRWLRERIWPYEAALDEEAIGVAAQLGCAELLRSGTTAILDMGTVRYQDALMAATARTGLRAVMGKAMMDLAESTPPGLRESTADSLAESDRLCRRWHGAEGGRLRYAYAPRFVLSCTERLLREVGERIAAGGEGGPRLHTHAAEQRDEVQLVRERLGTDNIHGLLERGLGGHRAVLAHCVHVDEGQVRALAQSGTHVAHCPSSNLKLGSGLAPVCELLAAGVNVAIGADGAACNNNLDGLLEARLCALLQKGRLGAAALDARQALHMATLGGARALGLEQEIGSLLAGKRADVIVLDAQAVPVAPGGDPAAQIIYALRGSDVRDVWVDGRLLVKNRELTPETGLDAEALPRKAAETARRVLSAARG